MAQDTHRIALAANLDVNMNGGVYTRGKEYTTEKKVEVALVYWRLKAQLGVPPSDRNLGEEARVGKTFAGKVKWEIQESGSVVPVEKLKEERWHLKKKGVGCHCLTLAEQQHLLQLRADNPSRSNESYIQGLLGFSGNVISSAFITYFFQLVGPFRGNFKKVSPVPIDKYKPSNIVTFHDYLNFVSIVPPHLLHFGDEKSLKGVEIFNRFARADPFTGQTEEAIVPPYFRNTYCLMGFVTINVTKYPPLLYTMGEDNHDAAAYVAFITEAVGSGWLRRGDMIVVDNAVVHSGGNADILAEFLWHAPGLDGDPLNIVVIPFPTRAPELNPIEKNWHTFVKRLKKVLRMTNFYVHASLDMYLQLAGSVLSNFTHEDNIKNYRKCGYLGNTKL